MPQNEESTRSLLRKGLDLVWYNLSLPFRLLMTFSKATLAVLALCLLLFSLALPPMMALSVPIFGVVAATIEALTSLPSVVKKSQAELGQTKAELERKKAELGRKKIELDATKGELKKAKVDLGDANIKLSKAEGKVIGRGLKIEALTTVKYRGKKVPISEAVADTSKRVATRVANSLKSEIASMAGEAIPYLGVAVIVGATVFDLEQSCEMMKELHELDVAFNPGHAIVDSTEVCGTRVPTAAELWDTVKGAPGAALDKAREALPDFNWEAGWSDLIERVPSADEVNGVAGGAIKAVAGWFPTFYWKEGWVDLTETFGVGTSP